MTGLLSYFPKTKTKIRGDSMRTILILAALFMLPACQSKEINTADIRHAEKLAALNFSAQERDSLLRDVIDQRKNYINLRKQTPGNDVAPALIFNPLPPAFKIPEFRYRPVFHMEETALPQNRSALAFYSVRQLAWLIKHRRISSVELTRFFLERLKKYADTLQCVITLTEERALAGARRADEEIAAGKYRGLLHGIPYGAKDLLSVKGYKTTWGAAPYKDQVIARDAAVIRKLDEAGAILVAKLTLGALAWGDVWFDGKTRNPWDPEQGSSGSSAGSASATAAGLVPFAIGTETWGSIVSPSTRCGTTGLRPTFGRISRAGAMALSWSMDKIGPIARSAEDAAVVFDALRGTDTDDPATINAPFNYPDKIIPQNIRIGYLEKDFAADSAWSSFHRQALETLETMGFTLVPVTLPDFPVYDMAFILSAEAAAAFDSLTLSNRDDLLVRQGRNAWPNVFRAARFIPAVEYIQANRVRRQLIEAMDRWFENIDLFIAPPFGENLLLTNLTGHPAVVLPNGFTKKGTPVSVTFTGKLFDEATILAVAAMFQQKTGYHLKHPPLFQK